MSLPMPLQFQRDLLRGLQYCYYVKSITLIPDDAFDAMEADYEKRSRDMLPVGSDKQDDYSPAERAMALYLAFRAKEAQLAGEALL